MIPKEAFAAVLPRSYGAPAVALPQGMKPRRSCELSARNRRPHGAPGAAGGLAEQISALLRDRPPLGAAHDVLVAWLARKADVLDAIAADAAEVPGLVDPTEARRVADDARAP